MDPDAKEELEEDEVDCDVCGNNTPIDDVTVNPDGTETCPECTPAEE